MPNPLLLLVDSDARSSRVLRVSLEQAGYEVATAGDGESALEELRRSEPAVVLTATALPKLDGYSLVRQMREQPALRATPVVFFTDKTAIEDRIRGLELGVEHYLAKPIYVRELLSLVGSLVARRLLVRIEQGTAAADGVVTGSLADLSMLDLLQSSERGKATLRLLLVDGHRRAEIVVREGHVRDAHFERLRGEEAVFRALVWPRGRIELWFEDVPAETTISRPTSKLIDAALGYIAEWNDVVAQLPGLSVSMSIDLPALRQRIGEIPDQLQGVLQLLDGRHTLVDVMDESPFDDLSTLQTIGRLYQEGLATAVSVGGDAAEERIVPRSQPGATAEGRRRTNPWLDDAESARAAIAPDSAAVSEQVVAAPRAKLDAAAPPGAHPAAATAGARVEPAVPTPSDFDEKIAERAVDALVGPTPATEPAPEQGARPVVVRAPKAPRPQATGPRTRIAASPRSAGRARDEAAAAAPRTPVEATVPSASGPSSVDPGDAPAPQVQPAEARAASAAGEGGAVDARHEPAGAEPVDLARPTGEATATAPTEDDSLAAGASDAVAAPVTLPAPVQMPTEPSAAPTALPREGTHDPLAQSSPAASARATPSSGSVRPPFRRGGRNRGGPPGAPGGPASREASGRRGVGADDDASGPESLRALGESGVSEAFLRSAPVADEPLEEPPFSEPPAAPLSPEQQARRRRLMRVVGAVVGLAVAVMAFIFLRDSGAPTANGTGSSGTGLAARTPPPASSSPSSPPTIVTTASAAAPTAAVADAGSADAGGADAGGADVDGADAGGDEALPEVADPLGEVRKLANAGRYHDSIPMAKAAIKADADNAEPYMYLAEAYRALGKHAEMQAAYDDCVARATKGVGMWCPYGKKK